MRIDVRKLHEQPADLQVSCRAADLQLEDDEFRFLDPVEGAVDFCLVGDEVLARGRVGVTAETECVRCLQQCRLQISAEVAVTYEHNSELLNPKHEFTETDEESAVYFDGETIHPEPELREAIMLELPAQPVCSESCRGLCRVCGADLNATRCSCSQPADPAKQDSPWKNAIKNIKLP